MGGHDMVMMYGCPPARHQEEPGHLNIFPNLNRKQVEPSIKELVDKITALETKMEKLTKQNDATLLLQQAYNVLKSAGIERKLQLKIEKFMQKG
jgi:hypothetical protein